MRKDYEDSDSVADDDPQDDVTPVPTDAPEEVGPGTAWVTKQGARETPEDFKDGERQGR